MSSGGVRDSIQEALVAAVRKFGVDGEIPDLELGRAKIAAHGDYASSAGMKLARVLRQDPKTIAARLAGTVEVAGRAATAEAVGGYVNFRLTDDWLRSLVSRVDARYGSRNIGRGERLQVEFASINPTGPLHIGHGRGTILGDSICRVLEFTGHEVQREYYVNSDNTQTRRFGASVYARLHGKEPPEGGYAGEYVTELAEMARHDMPGIDQLSEDGALWFGDPAEGDEEDRVVIRSNGQPTYFASDLGYLLSRFEKRGFHRVIEVWGADHHGYVPRMKSAVAALGFDADDLVVILHQMVNLKEGKMSKRAGRFVTLDELVDRVGSDAVRYFYLLRSPDTTIEFDLELALSQSNENPVFYAQYAHARLFNVELTAAERHPELRDEGDVSLLDKTWELDVARQLAFWPEVVEDAARLMEPHRVPYYVHDLATAVHRFYHAGNEDGAHRVVVDDPLLTRARLELCRAARHTLKTALDLIGV